MSGHVTNRLYRLMLVVYTLVGLFVVPAQSAPVGLEQANQSLEEAHLLFERGEFQRALDGYMNVIGAGYMTPSLWANAGTAAYRAGDTGRAVLYYSRALRLDPGYDRAAISLRFISPATNDSASDPLRAILGRTSPVLWVFVCQAVFLVLCFTVARLMATPNPDARGFWWSVLAWSGVLFIVLGGIAFYTHSLRVGGNDAVVLKDDSVARSEPRVDSVAQLQLPAGTIVRLTEEPRRGFVRCRLLDGSTGFLPIEALEKI